MNIILGVIEHALKLTPALSRWIHKRPVSKHKIIIQIPALPPKLRKIREEMNIFKQNNELGKNSS